MSVLVFTYQDDNMPQENLVFDLDVFSLTNGFSCDEIYESQKQKLVDTDLLSIWQKYLYLNPGLARGQSLILVGVRTRGMMIFTDTFMGEVLGQAGCPFS